MEMIDTDGQVAAIDTNYLIELEGCGDVLAYFAKGHHDPSAFAEAVQRQWDAEIDPSRVIHRHARWTPWCGTCDLILNFAELGKRGVFPVTYCDWI